MKNRKRTKKFDCLSVFRHAQSVGKHVGRFLVLSSSGVLTDLKVGNWELHGGTSLGMLTNVKN